MGASWHEICFGDAKWSLEGGGHLADRTWREKRDQNQPGLVLMSMLQSAVGHRHVSDSQQRLEKVGAIS